MGLTTGPAVSGVMADFSTLEASTFSHAFRMLLWSEFLQFHKVYFHGIRVSRGSGSGGQLRSETVVTSSPSELVNTKFVTVEDFGSLYPFLKSVWWGGHR